jgi:RNA polymerase sigma-70 factor, ECF subfamily
LNEPAELVSRAVLERAALGERAAQQRVLVGVYEFVRRRLYRLLLGRVQELDDLLQSALLRVLTGLPGYRHDAAFKTWVTGICVNVVRDHLRKKKRTPVTEALETWSDPAAAGRSVDQERRIEARDALNGCARVIEGMPLNQRTAFVLRAVYGHSIEEISTIMGSAQSTTRLRLYYARKAFRRGLKQGDSWPAGLLPTDAGGE